jgi:hypothetical protein
MFGDESFDFPSMARRRDIKEVGIEHQWRLRTGILQTAWRTVESVPDGPVTPHPTRQPEGCEGSQTRSALHQPTIALVKSSLAATPSQSRHADSTASRWGSGTRDQQLDCDGWSPNVTALRRRAPAPMHDDEHFSASRPTASARGG